MDEPTVTSGDCEPPTSGVRRALFVLAGLLCVGLAWLGAALPGLPTTPWVLLASYCFGRSSPRLQRWLQRSPVFGRIIRDWEQHRGIRRPVKVFAVCLIVVVVSISVSSGRLPVWLQWLIAAFAACGVSTILFVVPTIRDRQASP
jgi:uncharacterized membrane protein YbaN (DUF454 family)